MNTNRFETFFDAVLAIIITVLVLKLSQPASPTWSGVLGLNVSLITYFITFLVIFIIWYDNHNMFHAVEEIDNRVLVLYALQMFFISLLPYFASWISKDINSIAAQTMFGINYVLITVFYILAIYAVHRANPYNCDLCKVDFKKLFNYVPLMINLLGFIITYTFYTPGILICVLISVVFWLFFSRIGGSDTGDSERFEAFIDAIIAIIITVIVLEIPMVSGGSWEAFFELKLEFIVYAISFMVCFNYWNYNNNIFNIVNRIDSKVIWLNGASLFILSLIPFLTTFVGMHFNSFIPNFLYGLDFLIVAILSMMSAEALKNSDKANVALQLALGNNKVYLSTIVLVICGMLIGYFVYPPAVLISCLLSIVVIWLIPYFYKNF